MHGGSVAAGPGDISGTGWRTVLWRVVRAISSDDLWGVSAGVAFYAWFAAMFGLMFLASVYGLVAEPETIRGQIEALSGVLPGGTTRFLADQMQGVGTASKLRLGTGVGGALVIALWSARSAMATLIAALNITYRVREERRFLHLQMVTLALTAGAALFGAAVFTLAVLLPSMVDKRLPVGAALENTISVARWPVLAALMCFALAALYRFAPCRETRKWRWVSGGAVTATALWIFGSAGFLYYVANLSADSEAFGALSAVLVMQTWFYTTALAVLLGAKLNAEAEVEHRTHHAPKK